MKSSLKSVIRFLLFPLMMLFYVISTARNILFDIGFFKVRSFSVPVISVGNLSMGGTGKTPHVKKIVQILQAQKKRVSIVSRGYGGNYGGYATQVSAEKENAALVYGDEPVYFAKNLSSPVFVAHDRSAAVDLALKNAPCDVVVSDDSFQHRWMGRSRDIVLIDSTDDHVWLVPVGRYREPLSSLQRAHIVILTKLNFARNEQKSFWRAQLQKRGFSSQKRNLLESSYVIDQVELFRGVSPLEENAKVFLASSIARPQSFYELVKTRWQMEQHFSFPDHYQWLQKDVDAIEVAALDKGIRNLVITEKDAVKMESLIFRYLQVHIVKLEIKLEPELQISDLC